jgi:hypothetical protein
MKLKRRVLIVIGTFTIATISISSASALEIPNPLAKVFDQWQEQLNSINKYVSSTISQKLEELSESLQGDLKAAVNESVGALGLPDAKEAREKIEDIAASNNSAINSVDKATNEIDRQITRADSDSSLSKQGQQLTKEQVEKTQTSIEQVENSGEAAQEDVVTQNVMKRIAQQNTQIAGILEGV